MHEAASVAECAGACSGHPNCFSYTWKSFAYFAPEWRGHCYGIVGAIARSGLPSTWSPFPQEEAISGVVRIVGAPHLETRVQNIGSLQLRCRRGLRAS